MVSINKYGEEKYYNYEPSNRKKDKIDLQHSLESIVNLIDESKGGTFDILERTIEEIHDIAIQYVRPL